MNIGKVIAIMSALVSLVAMCFAVDARYAKKSDIDATRAEIEVIYSRVDDLDRKWK